MLLMICVCLALFFTLPIVIAVLEAKGGAGGSLQLEFWTFARSIGARCHLPVGRRRTPYIIKHTTNGEFRLSARKNLFQRWTIELRAYLDFEFGFAGRLCCPPQPPLKWRTPGMGSVPLFHDEEEHLTDYSVESSDESLARWLLRHPQVREHLSGCLEAAGAESVEFVLGNKLILVRMGCPAGWHAGDCVENGGHALFAAVQELSAHLRELFEVMAGQVDTPNGNVCGACAQKLASDPYQCRSCGAMVHRGCREMIGGCHHGSCLEAPDFMPMVEQISDEETVLHA